MIQYSGENIYLRPKVVNLNENFAQSRRDMDAWRLQWGIKLADQVINRFL